MENNNLAVLETQVAKRVNVNLQALSKSGIKYPVGYVPENAIKSAMFEMSKVVDKNKNNMLKKAMKSEVTFNSIINAVNNMLIQGLDAGKKQAYFIAYEDEVVLQRSYFGTVTMLERLPEIKQVKAFEYYEDNIPTFGFDPMTMSQTITSFNPNHKSKELAGAFAVIQKADDKFEITNMNVQEIHTAWSQSQNYGQKVWLNSPAEIEAAKKAGHNVKTFKKKDGTDGASYQTDEPNDVQKKFPGEMAKRTVINRAAKIFVNSSNAPVQLIQAVNETTENEYREIKEAEVIINDRDYGVEIQAVKSQQELDVLWNHIVPDDKKEENLMNYLDKKQELENENAVSKDD